MLTSSQKNKLLFGGIIVAAGIISSTIFFSDSGSDSSPVQPSTQQFPITPTLTQPTQNFTPGPQPAGEVPPGKVWSAEHGHWHDAAAGNQPLTQPAFQPTGQLTPQPAGEAPAGKVWSPEHAHWHDAPNVQILDPADVKTPDTP